MGLWYGLYGLQVNLLSSCFGLNRVKGRQYCWVYQRTTEYFGAKPKSSNASGRAHTLAEASGPACPARSMVFTWGRWSPIMFRIGTWNLWVKLACFASQKDIASA